MIEAGLTPPHANTLKTLSCRTQPGGAMRRC
jgi:hypothetical protein